MTEDGERGTQVEADADRVKTPDVASGAFPAGDTLYQAFFDEAPIGIAVSDGSFRLARANACLCEMLGYSEAELADMGWAHLVHPDDRDIDAAQARALFQGQGPSYQVEKRYFRQDGQPVWVRATIAAIRAPSGELAYALAMFENVTKRRDAETELSRAREELEARVKQRTSDLREANSALRALVEERTRADTRLRESEERYRRIVDTANEGIWVLDQNARTTYANQRLSDLFGYTTDELLGGSAYDLVFEADRSHLQANFERRRQGLRDQYDFRFRRKDGTELWTLISGNPVFSEDGRFLGTLAMLTDITERRELEERFRQSQKMEAVGRLAGGVAHDFNNMLAVILGYSDLLLQQRAVTGGTRSALVQIRRATERAGALTRQLLAFSRKQILQPQLLDLNAVLTDLDRMLRRLIGEDVELVTLPAEGLGRIHADPGQLEQVIVNLVVNARDAMPRGGTLTLRTANCDLGDADPTRPPLVPPGAYVLLSIADTGCGMDAATIAQIFEPFFTTKEAGDGTGLGLSTVHGIVHQSGGYIDVRSEPGAGTTFSIYLSRLEGSPAENFALGDTADPLRGTETILLVEDEGMVRDLACEILRACGYTVMDAAYSHDALRLLAEHTGRIQLLLTDVVMPQMSGRELAQLAVEIRPDLKVLFMSGYTDDAVVRHGVSAMTAAFIHKPFDTNTLARKVREVLDGTAR